MNKVCEGVSKSIRSAGLGQEAGLERCEGGTLWNMFLAFMRFIPLIPLRVVEILLALDNRLENSVLLLVFLLHPLRNRNILACDYVAKQSAEFFLSDAVFIYFLDKYNTKKKAMRLDQAY